ncbi:unnamed protein product [Ambrosiozyma monospora]|uniref:Unnamed protein product n=1 Tax=Ambrosiozyma monospora TaxID=43982 RepID=A0A9W6YVL8_AMBMO|nr:unnamed protein product [Ambrosiozyma monospora]
MPITRKASTAFRSSSAKSVSSKLKPLSASNSLSNQKHHYDSNPQSMEMDFQDLATLDHTLTKFNSFKKNSTTKTNVLRLVLLPYLRARTQRWPLNEYIQRDRDPEMEKYLLCATTVFLNWWKSLLNCVHELQSISSVDKNCYLECISRIVSRYEWIHIESNEILFQDILQEYRQLLLKTFEFSISRLNVKNISLSVNAFIGKMFAYAFFKLPDISNGLLFLIGTKVKNFEEIYNLAVLNKTPMEPAVDPITKNECVNDFAKKLNELSIKFPLHLTPLMMSATQPRPTKFKMEKKFLNSVSPPQQKIQGINETRGLWCHRWASLDNVDLFCSFLRHYLMLSSYHMKSLPRVMAHDYVFGSPGYLYILTHIYEILDFQVNQRIRQQQVAIKQNSFNGVLPPTPLEAQWTKILRVLGDFSVNTRHDYEPMLKSGVMKSIEIVLKLLVFKTPLLNIAMGDQVFDLFLNYVKMQKEHLINKYEEDELDWCFWINVLMKMLDSKSINCELRTFSILYQIWDYLPSNKFLDQDQAEWCQYPTENLKFNLAMYLVSDTCWNQYFYHYLPLVRSFYQRLLVWRLLGLTSLNLKSLTYRECINSKKLFGAIETKLRVAFDSTKTEQFRPMDPMANKKFTIAPLFFSGVDGSGVGLKQMTSSGKETIRTHPYEVIDDAVYMCSNLSILNDDTTSPSNSRNSSATSSPNYSSGPRLSRKLSTSWVGKFLRKKDPGSESFPNVSDAAHSDDNGNESNSSSPPTVSSRTLSKAASYSNLLQTPPRLFGGMGNGNFHKSSSPPSVSSSTKSSSPSLFSSITSLSSPQSSFASFEFNDSAAATSHATQPKFLPPELNMKPPELTKYAYKFQLVNNEIKMRASFMNLQSLKGDQKFMSNGGVSGGFQLQNSKPKLPSIKPASEDGVLSTGSPSDDGVDDHDFLGGVVRAPESNELLDDLDNDSFDGLQLDFNNDLSIFGNYGADFNWGVDTEMDTQDLVPDSTTRAFNATPPPSCLPEQANGNAGCHSPAPSKTDTIYYSAPGTPIQCWVPSLPSPLPLANSNSTETSFQSINNNNSNQALLTPLPSQSSIPALLRKNKELVCQAIYDYNSISTEFENFIIQRVEEINNCSGNGTIGGSASCNGNCNESDDMLTLNGSLDKDLMKLFPLLVPEAPEKLNGC